MSMVNDQTETWYEVEFRRPGQSDWVLLIAADTLELARQQLQEDEGAEGQFEYRIVRKTLTVEIVS